MITRTKKTKTIEENLEPLFADGPTRADLTTPGNPWRIPSELEDAYLDLVTEPTRQEWATIADRAEAQPLGLRDLARSAADLPPILGKQEADRSGAHYSGAIIDDQLAYDHTDGWPTPRPDLAAFRHHVDTIHRASERHRATEATPNRKHPHPCQVCDQPIPSGPVCFTCQPILEHARLLARAEEPIGNKTRLERALDVARTENR